MQRLITSQIELTRTVLLPAAWLQMDAGQGLDSVIKGFEGSAEFKAILNGLK